MSFSSSSGDWFSLSSVVASRLYSSASMSEMSRTMSSKAFLSAGCSARSMSLLMTMSTARSKCSFASSKRPAW